MNLLLTNPWLFPAAALLVDALVIAAVLAWYRYQPRHRRDHGHTGATADWSPAAEVAAQEQDTELALIQTSAEQRAEAEAIAQGFDADTNALLDALLDGIRAACDWGRDAILAPESCADVRAYMLRVDLHRNPDHTPGETASMQFRVQLDAMLAADGLDLVPAGAR
jgi:hypothetical protein